MKRRVVLGVDMMVVKKLNKPSEKYPNARKSERKETELMFFSEYR
jgi:hypothetical protein